MMSLLKILTERSVIVATLPIMLEIECYFVIFPGTFEVLLLAKINRLKFTQSTGKQIV